MVDAKATTTAILVRLSDAQSILFSYHVRGGGARVKKFAPADLGGRSLSGSHELFPSASRISEATELV